jgi:hypothetical protein
MARNSKLDPKKLYDGPAGPMTVAKTSLDVTQRTPAVNQQFFRPPRIFRNSAPTNPGYKNGIAGFPYSLYIPG